jgi:hypothetical protein
MTKLNEPVTTASRGRTIMPTNDDLSRADVKTAVQQLIDEMSDEVFDQIKTRAVEVARENPPLPDMSPEIREIGLHATIAMLIARILLRRNQEDAAKAS